MSDAVKGLLALVLANVIWGLSSIFYKHFATVPPLELLSHRTIWSFAFFALVLMIQGRLREVPRAFSSLRKAAVIVLAMALISVNWFLFIRAIQLERALEASLGYYIFPLVSVVMGVIVFGEAIGRAKVAAFLLAALAVGVLTVGLGAAPIISISLALTFGAYGVIKKFSTLGPVVSVTAEVAVVVPLALVWLWGVHVLGWTGITGQNLALFGSALSESLLLMASGPITAGPLILFSYASRRLTLATVGLTQYLNPTLQLMVAALVFAEPLTRWHAVAFPLIWTALAIYSWGVLRQERARHRAVSSAALSETTVTNSSMERSANP
ncbi:EamA family transporter RarD [Ponticoccus sp. SC2-23]|uniref:EamA family transporter RarD n=1 Tax=Alexandriicola marinus TaxID=2081710 RepID=UPI000FD8ED05|nr:EamA family transporter RarD [Alexandriicola marinus]MBM1222395.1 EamA family transporter RarD [Ponticoccus sp. SC6-9]MBM1224508.1 EamA family transporter RarD [Ponticoccus sp. SC6-15]MBM1229712.1 EamA family transporter RarD [Ponticoccus sp. SC6-38]MBM1233474.1 EamA family transporter RarD [Ponticoccus sp. SC6-45]MBM1236576.1 EamA family transporter RarD [Ponticoccus sp. SC6-49]MBM1244620.1 EamA family transporter RarD [Ponticoccus sp. SC2-64]MBM1246998.1 EamA family transporter RarD [Po